MNHRAFEPRPDGNDVRRRNAIGMAAIVLVAFWLWTIYTRPPATPKPVPGTMPVHVAPTAQR